MNTMAEVFVLVPAMTPGKALEIADDFLDGLIDHAAFLGYYDPDAGEASTVFALAAVRSARSALAVLPTEETTPFAHWRATVPEYPASYDDRVASVIKMMFNADGSPRTVRVLNDKGEWWEMEVSFPDPPAWHLLPTEETTGPRCSRCGGTFDAHSVYHDVPAPGTVTPPEAEFPGLAVKGMYCKEIRGESAPSYSELVETLAEVLSTAAAVDALPSDEFCTTDAGFDAYERAVNESESAQARARSLLTRIQGETRE